MNRFSVLYLLKEQYHHIGSDTLGEAEQLVRTLQSDKKRTPVGIYDAKTELFQWEPGRQLAYDQGNIEEQGKLGKQIIMIVQALRRRDGSWQPAGGFRRPSFFA